MAWKSITQDEARLCEQMTRWLETRKRWSPEEPWLPSNADLHKSALFERLRSGREPLEYPPPVGLACPWYALVEDPGPHSVGETKNHFMGPWFYDLERTWPTEGQVVCLQHAYLIDEQFGETEFLLRDAKHETPYRFRLWFDPKHQFWHGPGAKANGAWLMQNIKFSESPS